MLHKIKQLITLNRGSNCRFLPAYVVGLANMVCLMIPAQVLKMIIQAIQENDKSALTSSIGYGIVGSVLSVLFIYLNRVLLAKALNAGEKNLQLKMISRLFVLSKRELQQMTTGEFMTRITQNIPDAVNFGLDGAFSMVTGIAGLAMILAYMFFLSPELMGGIVIFNVVIMAVTTQTGKAIRRASTKKVEWNTQGNSLLLELLNNSMVMRLYNKGDFFQSMFKDNEQNIGKVNLRVFTLHQGTMEFIWSVKKIAEIALLYGLGGWLVVHGRADIGIIAAYTVVSDIFTKILKMATDSIITLNKAAPNIDAVVELLGTEGDFDPVPGSSHEGQGGMKPGAIVFDHVSFKHGKRAILDRATFTIAPGDKVMISGDNGTGKSTILHLISGLYKPDSGSVHRGGEVLYIPQESHILIGNTRENMTLERENSKGKKEDSCADLLNRLHMDNLQTDSPLSYSSGEKQRLTIGRAAYHREQGSIVLGDEIFSAVDKKNRDSIAKLITELFSEKTVLLVCHERIDFPFDKELYIKDGKIQIIEKEDGI